MLPAQSAFVWGGLDAFCKMTLPATTLSREKRKPEIRRFPAFITYEIIIQLNMARAPAEAILIVGHRVCPLPFATALFLCKKMCYTTK